MNTIKENLLLFLFLCLATSCGSKNSSEELSSEASNYKLAITDSVQVDIFGSSLSLVDVHSESGDLLIIQPDPPKLWIVSQEGKIKETWEKSGNGPDEIGSHLLSAEFFGEGVAMMGYMRLKIFDKNFRAIGSYKPGFDLQGMVYMGYNHLLAFESGGDQQLVTFFGGPQTEHHWDSQEFYNEYNVVDVINPKLEGEIESELGEAKNVFKPIGGFTEDSQFKKSGRSHMYIIPVFDVQGNELIYAFDRDTVLFKRELPSGELISSTPIPFDQFYLSKGWTMGKGVAEMNSGNVAPKNRRGNIERVFHSNGFDVIFYRSGLPLETIQAITLQGAEKAREEYRLDYSKHLILKEGERINKDLKTTDKIYAPSITDNSGFLWARQNVNALDKEPDLVTFYKLKIVPDEN